VIQCKIYPRVTESNGRVSVTLRTELRYSGKFEAYFTQNWFCKYLPTVGSFRANFKRQICCRSSLTTCPMLLKAIKFHCYSIMVKCVFYSRMSKQILIIFRTYDQPLAITSHGILTVTPTICYHSALDTTDKLFVVPLLPDGSQRVDTVVDASIVQPGEDSRAPKSEAAPTHPSPSLFQSVHSILHARASPVSGSAPLGCGS
jgi:hypothetical protein